MTACQDHQAGENAVKCLSQGHNRMAQVGFEPRPCWSRARRLNHSTTLPTIIHFNIFFYNNVSLSLLKYLDECRPFSWQEWANYHLERAAEVKKNPRNCFESSDVEAIDDLHAYSEHFKNVIVRSSGHGKEINTSLNTKYTVNVIFYFCPILCHACDW